MTLGQAWERATARRYGSPQWDAVLRGTGVFGLAALYPTWRSPEVAGLVGLLCLTLLLDGPYSPLLPTAFEPILILAGRLYHPVVVTLVATAGFVYMEFLNYHLYGKAAAHARLAKARESAMVRRAIALFQRRPFLAVSFWAFSPLPFWVMRLLAPSASYPVGPYLVAAALGRAPRFLFYAALGILLPVPTAAIVVVIGAGIVAALGLAAWKRYAPSAPSRL